MHCLFCGGMWDLGHDPNISKIVHTALVGCRGPIVIILLESADKTGI